MTCLKTCLGDCASGCYGCNPNGENDKFDIDKEKAFPCAFCIGVSTKGKGTIKSDENCELKAFGNVTLCVSVEDLCCCPKEKVTVVINGTAIDYPFDQCVEVCDGETIDVEIIASECWNGAQPKKCGNTCGSSGFSKTLFKKSVNSIGLRHNILKNTLKYNKPMKVVSKETENIDNIIKEAIEYVRKNHPRWENELKFYLKVRPNDAEFAIPAFKEVERGLKKLPEGFTFALSHARINDIINIYKLHKEGSVEALGRGQIKLFRDTLGLENIHPDAHLKGYVSIKEILKILPDNLLDKIPAENFKNISDDMYLSLPKVLKDKLDKKTILF